MIGRAIAQAVSRRFPTAAARVRDGFRSSGIFGGQSGTGVGFLQVLPFPLPIRIPPIVPQSSSSVIWGQYNRPNSGRSTKWTQSHPMMMMIMMIIIIIIIIIITIIIIKQYGMMIANNS
jgi:hypothetical protein